MTKQEARIIVIGTAKHFKRMGFDANFFEEKIKHGNYDDEFAEAYNLIKDEMIHIRSVVWGWNR